MAKKVTIEGSNKLQSLSDPWGGVGDGNPVYNTNVPEGAEWGMNRGEVERFIKKQFGLRIGWLHRDEDNYLCGFASEDDYNTWAAAQGTEDEEDVADLLLTRVKLPDVVNEDTYRVMLTIQELPAQMQTSSQVSIAVKGSSFIDYANGTTANNDEQLEVFIDTSTSGAAGSWVAHNVGRITANDSNYSTFSLESLLSAGVNYLRVRLVGEYASSLPKTFSLNIVNLALTPASDFSVPFTDSLFFDFFINGSVSKSLQFEFCTGSEGDFTNVLSWSVDIGEGVNMSTARSVFIPASVVEEGGLLEDGRHVFRVRLYHSSSIKTDWVICEYMVGEQSAIVINDIHSRLTNWTAVTFFKWATQGVDGVEFQMYDEDNTNFIDSWGYPATSETNIFSIQLSLDIASEIENYGITLRILDNNGNTLHPPISFIIENDSTFAPAESPDFVMIPANRDNTEAGRATIINEANNSVLDANETVFDGFGWLNDGWVSVLRDINDNTSGDVRALHIPAHHRVEIPYNPFSGFTGNNNNNQYATFELDFRVNNVLDYSEPIVQIGTENNGLFWGLELLPTKGYLLTSEKTSTFDQDVDWAEDVRVHLAVNVVMSDGLRLVRLFINGTIEREFLYTTSDKFTAASGVKIKIGNTSSDIDVFGIRSYKRQLATSEVMQDYKASLENADDKIAYNEKNDILVGGLINWTKCINLGYNVIGHIGPLPHYVKGSDDNPTYGGKSDANGLVKLVIRIAGDDDNSCTLTNLEAKGQGTTAMTYFHWNQSYKVTSNTRRYDVNGNEVEGKLGKGYAIATGEPAAKKLVGKINFASSMQSHKLGLTWIFTEIYKRLVDAGTIDKPSQMVNFPNSRIAVYEKPFFFFHKENESDQEWTFKYLMTFGAGKGDKPTFGFNEDETGNMMMVEGADNEPALCNFARPWDNDGIYYNPSKEAWYEGREDDNYIVKSINFGFGKVTDASGVELPVDEANGPLDKLRAFWNFAYLHHTGIQPHTGTLTALRSDTEAKKDSLYWVTTADENAAKYDLFRFDRATNNWVHAGMGKSQLNLFTQYGTFGGEKTLSELNQMTLAQINDEFTSVRRSHFRANAADYFHIDDALYHSCFVKLFAATDNRAKNTYYYTDPVTLKVRWMQDDLDTVLRTNNMGQNRKPYYIEEHDKDESGSFYWKGEGNGFYNLLEEAFPTEMRAMMAQMLGAMSAVSGSVMNYLEDRLLFVQRTAFPSIAYNEQARLTYESAQVAQNTNEYVNATAPITQSMGCQLLSEYQWLLDRVMYISSWCEYGRFGAVSGGAPPDSWSFRSGGNGYYNFVFKSSKWIYPRVFQGGTKISPKVGVAHYRLKPYDANDAESVLDYQSFSVTDGDVTIAVAGIDYLLDIGDINFSVAKASTALAGKRMRRIAVNEGGNTKAVFEPSSISSVPKNITEFIMRYVSIEGAANLGTLDLSSCYRLEKIDLTGSEFTTVSLPRTERLFKAVLPASLTSLVVDGCPNLGNTAFDAQAGFTLEGSTNLTSITIKDAPHVPSYAIINAAKTADANLTSVVLQNITWGSAEAGVDAAVIDWLTNIPNCELTGTIYISNLTPVTFDMRVRMLEKWGEALSSGDLVINYTLVTLGSIQIGGDSYIHESGYYQYGVVPNNANANNFSSVVWSVGWKEGITPPMALSDVIDNLDEFAITGRMHITDALTFQSISDVITIEVTIGSLSESLDVGLYEREAQVGDYVFYDGTYSDVINPLKKIAGVCFYIGADYTEVVNGVSVTKKDRRMVGLVNLSYKYNGGTYATWWGLMSGTADNSIALTGITCNDSPAYTTIYDTPLVNSSGGGTGMAEINLALAKKYNSTINESGVQQIFGVPAGTKLPLGHVRTLELIAHRNRILSDSNVNLSLPSSGNGRTEFESLIYLMDAVILANYSDNQRTRYAQLYYPAASLCHHYALKNSVFGEHQWYLPTVGEMDAVSTNVKSILASLNANYNSHLWTSDEFSEIYARTYNINGGSSTFYGKSSSSIIGVRPCCSF